MDVGKGWPTEGCASSGVQDKSIINRIMLRFRPIAPKPVADGSATGSAATNNKSELVPKQRAKRKYVRVKKVRKCKITREEEKKDLSFDGSVVAFQPLPETKVFPEIDYSSNMGFSLQKQPMWMNFDKSENNDIFTLSLRDKSDRAELTPSARVLESWVVVDGMTKTWVDVGWLGSTDTEKMRNLEVDTCPGLISDGLHRVQWVNLAYKRMVDAGQDNGASPVEVMVWLAVKENMPVLWPVFACTVRVVYTWRKEKHSQTMPCDVWKMDFGGFAWRLDAKAALSLGR